MIDTHFDLNNFEGMSNHTAAETVEMVASQKAFEPVGAEKLINSDTDSVNKDEIEHPVFLESDSRDSEDLEPPVWYYDNSEDEDSLIEIASRLQEYAKFIKGLADLKMYARTHNLNRAMLLKDGPDIDTIDQFYYGKYIKYTCSTQSYGDIFEPDALEQFIEEITPSVDAIEEKSTVLIEQIHTHRYSNTTFPVNAYESFISERGLGKRVTTLLRKRRRTTCKFWKKSSSKRRTTKRKTSRK